MAAPALRQAPATPNRLSYPQAFREAVQIVHGTLQELGMQWTADAEQHAVCTLIISADKRGLLFWESPSTPAPVQAMPDPPAQNRDTRSRRPNAPVTAMPSREPDLAATLAASIRLANARKTGEPPAPAAPPTPASAAREKPEPWFPVMLRAYRSIQDQIPPEVFSAVLSWFEIEDPDSLTPADSKRAISCYVALQSALKDYRVKTEASYEHFEATEEGWR